jgi:hypothetical protein
MRQAAEEDATLWGVLADLGERRVAVALRTRSGRSHQGAVRVVGDDFVALRTATGELLVAVPAIGIVRTAPGVAAATGDRSVRAELGLGDVLARLAAERERVLVVTLDGDDAVSGQLRSVGNDVVVIRTDSDRPVTAYVRLAAIGEVTVG